jgi:hypothetical protein
MMTCAFARQTDYTTFGHGGWQGHRVVRHSDTCSTIYEIEALIRCKIILSVNGRL